MKFRTGKRRIDVINTYLDPIRFYGFRLMRMAIFYWAFLVACRGGTANIPGGDPDMYNYNPSDHHAVATLFMLFIFIFIAGIFILYDPTARRRFCKAPPPETHLFSEELWVLRSYEFWCDVIGLTILPLLIKTDLYAHPLYFFFRREDFSQTETYLRYLLTIFPIMLLIRFILRVRTRRHWRDLSFEEAKAKKLDWLKILFLWYITLIGFGLGVISLYLEIFRALMVAVIMFPLPILAVILLIVSLRYLRAVRIRRSFLKRLKKICKDENFELSEIKHPYRSIFFRNHDYHFTVRAYGKTYACKLLASVSKNSPMIFIDEIFGYHKMSIRLKSSEFVLFRKKFYHDFESPNADHKVLIVSPAPHTMRVIETTVAFVADDTTYVKESARFRYLDNASHVFGATIFSGSGFLNALERNCLYVKPEH